jgi:7-carboxy-7-deazaguanine synthase
LENQRIPVYELFYSLQGEGYHSGKASFFIRFAGCDIACAWCDTPEAWTCDHARYLGPSEILEELQEVQSKIVVITGGEPMMHDLREITRVLRKEGYIVHLETSGAYPLRAEFDWLCVSPKRIMPPGQEYYAKANELKFVIRAKADLDFALSEAQKASENACLLLQPEWSHKEEILPSIIAFIKKNPLWQLSLQTHKYLDIP